MMNTRFTLSSGEETDSFTLAREALRANGITLPKAPTRIAVTGDDQHVTAAITLHLLNSDHQVVLVPTSLAGGRSLPRGCGYGLVALGRTVREVCPASRIGTFGGGWRVALYSSGSTRAAATFGFDGRQLDTLAAWYAHAYGVTAASVIVTSLPVSYNFTFVAGLILAAASGAALRLVGAADEVLAEAACLAVRADRVVVLANPVTLDSAKTDSRLPDHVLVDSGGAPLSTPGLRELRHAVADVREGYGLTETGSLTHFDLEGSGDSLGTVGTSQPGVRCWIEAVDDKPRIALETPVIGTEVAPDGTTGRPRTSMLTGDLGTIGPVGRLRLLGRADDHRINGFWPRDTLDMVAEVTGARCALVLHPNPDRVRVKVLGELSAGDVSRIRSVVAHELALSPAGITVEGEDDTSLHSRKLSRRTP
ncbi:AMP-binding protein [Actinoalloteichus fjordicus]|uniref:AMP-binding enzyme n=1 Tax=Actinoalloteichus fjordicus TaxID=1612552 RepID=A0AAC9LEA1_9PSEU|nr:AMP-binding protein [Actinoalloteichus fjordicus]APU15255.1 AMP-binding enzyme [Actinoalloteichus fjordicus]